MAACVALKEGATDMVRVLSAEDTYCRKGTPPLTWAPIHGEVT